MTTVEKYPWMVRVPWGLRHWQKKHLYFCSKLLTLQKIARWVEAWFQTAVRLSDCSFLKFQVNWEQEASVANFSTGGIGQMTPSLHTNLSVHNPHIYLSLLIAHLQQSINQHWVSLSSCLDSQGPGALSGRASCLTLQELNENASRPNISRFTKESFWVGHMFSHYLW